MSPATAEGEFQLCAQTAGGGGCVSKTNHLGTLVYGKMKNCSDLHRFYFMSKCHIYIQPFISF